MKLLIRGGSIAAGIGVKKCYADILEESLLKKGIEVISRSRSLHCELIPVHNYWTFLKLLAIFCD